MDTPIYLEELPYSIKRKSILFILSQGVSDFRMKLAARWLQRAGYGVELITAVPYYKLSQHDLIVCCRPGAEMCVLLDVVKKAGIPFVLDLDDDFASIPKHNPAYEIVGKGSGHVNYHEDLMKTVTAAEAVVYASGVLQDRYSRDGIIIPNCWDEEDGQWYKPHIPQDADYVTILFSGTPTHREDFKLVYPALNRILTEREDVHIAVNVDWEIYKQFDHIPQNRKMFIPGVPYEEYPACLRWGDIMVVPLQDDYFNRAKSDVKVMEAGAATLPWVASPLPQYQAWGVGGLFADSETEWYSAMSSLIDDCLLRAYHAKQGHEKALTRTSQVTGKSWIELLGGLL